MLRAELGLTYRMLFQSMKRIKRAARGPAALNDIFCPTGVMQGRAAKFALSTATGRRVSVVKGPNRLGIAGERSRAERAPQRQFEVELGIVADFAWPAALFSIENASSISWRRGESVGWKLVRGLVVASFP